MTRSAVTILACATLLGPAPAGAWGLQAHRWVATRAAEIARGRCPALIAGHERELAARAVEPDTVLKERLGHAEKIRHYLDLDHYGPPPFRALPRAYDDAVRRYGRAAIEEQGVLPWYGGELARRLADELRRHALDPARITAGYLAHYAADATMPLHATENHDGQRTRQRGLHARVEHRLVDADLARYVTRARPPRRRPIAPARAEEALFAALLRGYALVAPILEADRAARRGTRVGSTLYYRRLEVDLGAPLATQLADAAALTAALWEGACVAAAMPVTAASPTAASP